MKNFFITFDVFIKKTTEIEKNAKNQHYNFQPFFEFRFFPTDSRDVIV